MNKKWIVLILTLVFAMAMLSGCSLIKGTPEATATPVVEEVPGTAENPDGGMQEIEDEVVVTEAPEATAVATVQPAATATVQPTATATVQPTAAATATATVAPTATAKVTAKPTEEAKVELPEFGTTEYEKYLAMSASQQEAFIKKFDSVVDFVNWYNDALDEYQKLHPDIEIDGGEIDLGEVFGGN